LKAGCGTGLDTRGPGWAHAAGGSNAAAAQGGRGSACARVRKVEEEREHVGPADRGERLTNDPGAEERERNSVDGCAQPKFKI
jgi:hypothetical protein